MQKIQRKHQGQLTQNVLSVVNAYFDEVEYDSELPDIQSEVESAAFEAMMKYTRGNQVKAAVTLGVARGTLRRKLQTYFDTTQVGGPYHAPVQYRPDKRV